jgi:hypothetical protein
LNPKFGINIGIGIIMSVNIISDTINRLDASTSTNILKVLGDSGDKVYAAGFGDSTIDKTTAITIKAIRIGNHHGCILTKHFAML